MGLWQVIRHPRRWLDLLEASERLKANWRNPDMDKLTQREFWMPLLMAIVVMLNDLYNLDMSEDTMTWASALIAGAVVSILIRKKVTGETEETRIKKAELKLEARKAKLGLE